MSWTRLGGGGFQECSGLELEQVREIFRELLAHLADGLRGDREEDQLAVPARFCVRGELVVWRSRAEDDIVPGGEPRSLRLMGELDISNAEETLARLEAVAGAGERRVSLAS